MIGGPAAATIEALCERGEREGTVRESDLERLAEEFELGAREIEAVRERLADRGVLVDDDCGRPAPSMSYANGELARYAVDALEQFMTEATRHRLLSAAEELELAKRIERGDLAAKEQLVTHNIRLVVSIAKRYQGTEIDAARPHPGRDDRADPRRGEVRLARGFRFSTYATLWIRQSIGPRPRPPLARDQAPGGGRPARADARRRAHATRDAARPGADVPRRSRTPPAWR